MSGRGDNNKKGSAGRGAANQSNQGFDKTGSGKKSNHAKNAEEGKASAPQKREPDQSSNRDRSIDGEKE